MYCVNPYTEQRRRQLGNLEELFDLRFKLKKLRKKKVGELTTSKVNTLQYIFRV